jgi:hypothetical protein
METAAILSEEGKHKQEKNMFMCIPCGVTSLKIEGNIRKGSLLLNAKSEPSEDTILSDYKDFSEPIHFMMLSL